MNTLHERIIEISKAHGLSHLGSCLTAVNIIDEIYATKKEDERFVLSCGHAGLALYVVLEKYFGLDAEQLYIENGTHPNKGGKIDVSTGSLGMGIGIAVGIALADRTKDVYCLISDGESFEGSVYEALNLATKLNLRNLKVYCNYNHFTAYEATPEWQASILQALWPDIKLYFTSVKDYGFEGLEAHYIKAT